MKFQDITAFFLAALTLCSCGREEVPERTGEASGPATDIVLRAGLVSVKTRTWLDSQGSEGNPTKKVYWSDGDRINVNGQISSSVSVTEGQKVSEAEFHLRSVDGPYNVIYPHDIVIDEIYDTAGYITISLASEQTYHPTTFASGAAVMYGYGESESIALHNLCAAVRVNLTGSESISAASVVSESAQSPICGTFRLCPQTGELVPIEANTLLSLDFKEVTLSHKGTDFYFTIPAGDYSAGLSFYFTNASDGRKMQCVWKPENVLEAGRLYSFNDVRYAPEAKDIETAQEWEEFVLALAGKGDLGKYLYKDGTARIGADIEGNLSSVTGDFTYVLDGAGHTLTRTNASGALLDNVSGEVRNLTIAGRLALKDEGAALVNTLAESGKISGCTNNMAIVFDAADHAYVGGLVKLINGGSVENCTNNGTIDVTIDISAADKNAAVGGIVAQINAANREISIKNCKNTANICLAPVSAADASYGMKVCSLGGVAGWLRAGDSFTFENCDNTGNVTLSAEHVTSATGTKAYSISTGGIIGLGAPYNTDGYLATPTEINGFILKFTDCDNSGTVHNCGVVYAGQTTTIKKQINKRVFTGGLAGSLLGRASDYAAIESCSNTGAVIPYDLTGSGASTQACYSSVVGGLIGFGGYIKMDKCTVNCTLGTDKRAVMAFGGVIGTAERPFSLNDSNIYISGHYQRIGNYGGNRAIVAAVPVLFGTTATNTMNIVPVITGSSITDCRIGGCVRTAKSMLSTANGEKTDDLSSGTWDATMFSSAESIYLEDGTVNNLVYGQEYKTVATDVTVTGFTYWDGR